jgi:hypothetical protein
MDPVNGQEKEKQKKSPSFFSAVFLEKPLPRVHFAVREDLALCQTRGQGFFRRVKLAVLIPGKDDQYRLSITGIIQHTGNIIFKFRIGHSG